MAKNPYSPSFNKVTRKGTVGPSFTALVGRITEGENPAQTGAPPSNRGAVTQTLQESFVGNDFKGSGLQFRQDPANTRTDQTASFVVSDNDFTDATWAIKIAGYDYRVHVDWTPGGTTILTATSIVAAINSSGGPLSADNVGGTSSTVTVSYEDTASAVPFRIEGTSSVVNFTSVTPTRGFMAPGSPDFQAPVVS